MNYFSCVICNVRNKDEGRKLALRKLVMTNQRIISEFHDTGVVAFDPGLYFEKMDEFIREKGYEVVRETPKIDDSTDDYTINVIYKIKM